MAEFENTQNKGRNTEQIKSDLRRFMKRWHADVGGTRVESGRSEDLSVAQVLSHFFGGTNDIKEPAINDLSKWPEYFTTGMRIVFPEIGSGQAVFLPKTPEEFFDLLDYVSRFNALPQKEYSLVKLSRGKQRKLDDESEERNERFVDETLEKFRTYISTRETIDELLYALDLRDMYTAEQLEEIEFSKNFDERAFFLFSRDAWSATTKEDVEKILEDVDNNFLFYSESTRANTVSALRARIKEIDEQKEGSETPSEIRVRLPADEEQLQHLQKVMKDRAARKQYISELRSAETIDRLNELSARISSFPFANRAELGVVRSVLSRKMRKLAQ